MKRIQVRLPEHIIEWINDMAKKEGVATSTMIRLYLDRQMYRESIEKQFNKEKRGK